MIGASPLDITIYQGATFQVDFKLKDNDGDAVSLAGATIRGKIREAPESSAALVSFTGTVTGASTGEGQFSLTATQTAALSVDPSGAAKRKDTKRVYDVEVEFSDGYVVRIFEGVAYVRPEATY